MSESTTDIPVLIIGAGPAGLIMALSLIQSGIQVRIIDKNQSFRVGSRGFGVQPRTFELFKILGLDEVQKQATPIPTMRAYKLPGGTEVVKTWDLYEKTGVIWPDRPYANGACLSQTVLEEIIRDRLAVYGVTVELNKELTDIQQDEESVTATIAHHFNDARDIVEIVRARYLIGADGAKGATRKLLNLTFQGETRDADGMIWGDVEIKGLTNDYWHIWGKPGHYTIMARPLSSTDNTFGIGITGQNFDPTDLAEPTKVKQFIHTETGRTDLEFGDFSWLSYFKPNMRMVNKFQEGRAFVVGGTIGIVISIYPDMTLRIADAAHVHSPTGGQGMNCSVQDSSNLAWKLALVLKGHSLPDLLSSFNLERLPVITQMLHATTALYTHSVAKEKPLDEPENKEDKDTESGWFRWRNSALEMYGINCRFSDIVIEERDTTPLDPEDVRARAYSGYEGRGSLRAGDRAPEAPKLIHVENGIETSLFSLFKPSIHTAVIFAVEGHDDILIDAVDTLSKYPEGIVQVVVIRSKDDGTPVADGRHVEMLIDEDGHAHHAYMIKDDPVIVIVRPDTFIGAIVKDGAGIGRYFGNILAPC